MCATDARLATNRTTSAHTTRLRRERVSSVGCGSMDQFVKPSAGDRFAKLLVLSHRPAEAKVFTIDLKDFTMVRQSIQQGRCPAFALEDLAPVAERQVAGQQKTATFVHIAQRWLFLSLPGFAAFVAVGAFDPFFVLRQLDDLVQDCVEFFLVWIANLSVVSQFDDGLTGDLRELGLVKVRSHKTH